MAPMVLLDGCIHSFLFQVLSHKNLKVICESGDKLIKNDSSDSFKPFISANPITSFNPVKCYPQIDETAFISPFSSVIGDVVIKDNVFIASNVSIRADEGTPFHIGSNVNIQDSVILHGLLNKRFWVGKYNYSIYIGNDVTIAHGSLIHGPCYIGKRVFVGFRAMVYDAIIEKGAFISYDAIVTNGVRIPPN